ncbi:MAG: fused MFS/spermidine synthase [Planctomycetes bacterium]|nr:fused MFS/spermidine synthase [Planctomycetota bacterium]
MRVLPFAAPVLAGAFLLFLVQPLIARFILPWFGGAAGVWSVAMLFFQAVLLAGYGYAHLLTTRLGSRAQCVVHCVVLAAAAISLPIAPSEWMKPSPDAAPTAGILFLLAATVGAPYFALSATGPLLQAWFARAVPGRSPYPLYALSNFGSLLALVAYPFVLEPAWGRGTQAIAWSWAFGAFALLCAGAALLAARVNTQQVGVQAGPAAPRRSMVLWIALPALASTLLLAYTHELCVDVASVPMLWVLPLALYLVSFIVTFAGRKPLPRFVWYPVAAIAIAATSMVMAWRLDVSVQGAVICHGLCLLALCVVLHGEAFRIRPVAGRLTQFYLCVSLGGVLGGLFVAVLAPLVFPAHLELPLALVFSALLLGWVLWSDPASPLGGGKVRPVWGLVGAGVGGLVFAQVWNFLQDHENSVLLTRNFYGTYMVAETPAGQGQPWFRSLSSGTTQHGSQFMEPEYRDWPTTYYARHSGIGLALHCLPSRPRRVGVVGLGVGTLAAYGRKGDLYRFYEINPRCEQIARDYFFFLQDSPADCQVILGDARLSMEGQEPQQFDLIALDAFTSDSIPVHLLTLEALGMFAGHLAPGGVLCVHISNRHLDLAPVLREASQQLRLSAFEVESPRDDSGANGALWVILGGDSDFEAQVTELAKHTPAWSLGTRIQRLDRGKRVRPWTDDYSNLFEVLR